MASAAFLPSTTGAVLVASPSSQVRDQVLSKLERRGPVHMASGGAEALAKLESGHWQVLFLDRRLPDLDAEELVEIIEQRYPGIRVVMVDSGGDECELPAFGAAPRELQVLSNRSALTRAMRPETALPGMIGDSQPMQELSHMVRLVAPRNTTVREAGTRGLESAPLLSWGTDLLLGLTVPVIGLAWLAAAAGSASQGGLVFAPSALAFKFSRLSPASRIKQLFSLPALSRLLRSVFPVAAVLYVAGAMLVRDEGLFLKSSRLSGAGIVTFIVGRAFELTWKSGLILLAWAAVDYLLERQHLAGELRMTRQELIDDFKESEGNPLIKGRIRRLRRQTLRRRMLEDTKRASVVITNPHEFAVALEYKPAMAAPMVVAKGRNLLAQQIKQVARWHGIPMVENRPLAHALYRAAEIGQYIPPKLYSAVAAILAAIYRAERRAQAAGAWPTSNAQTAGAQPGGARAPEMKNHG